MSLSIIQGLKYRSLDTPIHRLDPRVKLAVSIYLLTVAISYGELGRGMLLAGTSIICVGALATYVGRCLRPFLNTLRGGLPLVALVVIVQLLSISYSDLHHVIYTTSAFAVRFLAFISSFSVFFLTTSPEEVGLTLSSLRVPYTYTFALVTSIKFAPVIAEEVQNIVDAQRSRGVEFEKGGPIRRLRSLLSVLIPLMVNSLRRSYELAEAMEVKCFGANKKRTSYRILRMRPVDYLVLSIATALFILALFVRYSELSLHAP